MEFSGYAMSAATMETLSKIDLGKSPVPAMEKALVIDRAGSAAGGDLVRVTERRRGRRPISQPAGLCRDGHGGPPVCRGAAPDDRGNRQLVQGVGQPGAWARPGTKCLPQRRPPSPSNANCSCPPRGRTRPARPNGRFRLAPGFPCLESSPEPAHTEVRRRGVVLINAGADYHMGPSRMYVSLARRWTRNGYYVLRLDLAGLGDSDTRPNRTDDEIFPPAALDDIRDAVAYLRERCDVREITLMGLCSGAYHALRAAAAGLPVERVLLVNPQNYFWSEDMTLDDLQLAEVVRNPGVYKERIYSASAWRRLLTGRVNVWRIFMIYAYRQVLVAETALRNVARALRIRLRNDLGCELEDIVGRGVQITFIFAAGEPGHRSLEDTGRLLGQETRGVLAVC